MVHTDAQDPLRVALQTVAAPAVVPIRPVTTMR